MITHLPKLIPNLRQLQLSIDFFSMHYAEAGEQKEIAWQLYNEAIDNEMPRHIINDLFATAQLFDDICRDTWAEWQEAKKQLLDVLN